MSKVSLEEAILLLRSSCFDKGGVAVGEMSPLSETWTKGMVGDVGLARDDGHPLQPRQGDRQGNANVGSHLSSIGLDQKKVTQGLVHTHSRPLAAERAVT